MKVSKQQTLLGWFMVTAMFVVTFGCSDEIALRRITGKVTLDGQPLENGQVVITPEDQKSSAAAAEIVDGEFSCPVMPGEKKVAIQAFSGGINEMGFPVGKQVIPKRYNDESTLTISVENTNGQTFEFDIESK